MAGLCHHLPSKGSLHLSLKLALPLVMCQLTSLSHKSKIAMIVSEQLVARRTESKAYCRPSPYTAVTIICGPANSMRLCPLILLCSVHVRISYLACMVRPKILFVLSFICMVRISTRSYDICMQTHVNLE